MDEYVLRKVEYGTYIDTDLACLDLFYVSWCATTSRKYTVGLIKQ